MGWLRRPNLLRLNHLDENDDDFVHIRVPRERMAPVGYGVTETMQYKVSHSAGLQQSGASSSLRSVEAAGTRVAAVLC